MEKDQYPTKADQTRVLKVSDDFDTALWNSESDAFTKRAIQKFKGLDGLYGAPAREEKISMIRDAFAKIRFVPKNILDVGCGTGGFLKLFHDAYDQAGLAGIDPGPESIRTASDYFRTAGIDADFKVGHSHDLKFEDSSMDLVSFFKVLQWVPRRCLIKTVAEADRVLKTGGFVVVDEFFPFKPVFRQSKHNKEVYIFKQDYPKIFKAFPWYRVVMNIVHNPDASEDYIDHLVILKKMPLSRVYAQGSPDDL